MALLHNTKAVITVAAATNEQTFCDVNPTPCATTIELFHTLQN